MTGPTARRQTVGQIVVFGGSPGWVFMNVDVPTAEHSVKCEFNMCDGSVLTAGTLDVHGGTGVLATKIQVDTDRLRCATFYDHGGAVVGTATFA